MKKIRALYRFLIFVAYTCFKVGEIILKSLVLGEDMQRSMQLRREWLQQLLPWIGVRFQVTGKPPEIPCLIMSNHRSYLDPVVLLGEANAFPVSKAEVAAWPIIGYGAKMSGVLFLKRESAGSRKKTLENIGQKLREGNQVLLFPEGTTHSAPKTKELRIGGFNLAVAESVPVVPVAIDYRNIEDYWVGDDTFLGHFFRRFGEKNMDVRVHFGQAIFSENGHELMLETKKWIDQELLLIQNSWKSDLD